MITTSRISSYMPQSETARMPHDVELIPTLIVNLFLYGRPGSSDWVLIDAGIPGFSRDILLAAERRFGPTPPRAIILTHGHFDHVGSLPHLLEYWDVPVYAHPLELPFLTGRSDYPPPDPTVGGGLMARSAKLYPRRAIDLGSRACELPDDHSIPFMPGWRWIHTPGHTPGHVSFFRDSDRALIAGDAFCTQKQESLLSVITRWPAVHGPPKYFTIDWQAAAESVRCLASLNPAIAVTGHGRPMAGEALRAGLQRLAAHFEEDAIPRDGRYVREPALADRSGITRVPPPVFDPTPWVAVGVVALAAGLLWSTRQHEEC